MRGNWSARWLRRRDTSKAAASPRGGRRNERSESIRSLAVGLIGAAAFLSAAGAAPAETPAAVFDKQVFQACRELVITLPVEREKARALVPNRYPLAGDDAAETSPVTLRTANCDYTIDGETRPTLEAEVRVDLDTARMNDQMNEGDENDSHVAGWPVCCDWYELSEASNEQHFAAWYKAGTAMGDVVVLARDLEWRFERDAMTGLVHFHFKAPSPAEWAFEISATLQPLLEPATKVAINIWHETEEGQVQVIAHDDGGDSEVRLGAASGTVTAQGSRLASLLGDERREFAPGLEGVWTEIENGVLSKRVNGMGRVEGEAGPHHLRADRPVHPGEGGLARLASEGGPQ